MVTTLQPPWLGIPRTQVKSHALNEIVIGCLLYSNELILLCLFNHSSQYWLKQSYGKYSQLNSPMHLRMHQYLFDDVSIRRLLPPSPTLTTIQAFKLDYIVRNIHLLTSLLHFKRTFCLLLLDGAPSPGPATWTLEAKTLAFLSMSKLSASN